MSNLQETVQQVLKRLLNMETRIEGLHEENVELKKENAVIKKNLQHVEKRLVDTEIDNDRLKHEMDILPGRAKDVGIIMTKVKDLEDKVKVIPGLEKKMSKVKQDVGIIMTKVENIEYKVKVIPGLEKKMSKVKQEFQKNIGHITGLRRVLSRSLVDRQNIPDLYKKVEVLGSRIDAIDGEMKTRGQQTSSLEQRLGGQRRLLLQSSVDKQNFPDIYQKVDDLGSRIDAIDGEVKTLGQLKDDCKQSVTRAKIGTPTGGLVTGQGVKMDCVKVYGTTGVLEETTGCLVPKRKGRYFVGMKMYQDGDGEIVVRMRYNGDQGIGQPMVKTGRDGDIQSGVCVAGMNEGKEFWFEARREKGDAEIGWCVVYCWFLCPW